MWLLGIGAIAGFVAVIRYVGAHLRTGRAIEKVEERLRREVGP